MAMYQTLLGDMHVHPGYRRDSTSEMVKGAIDNLFNLLVLVYDEGLERFDKFVEKPGLKRQYYRSSMGNVMKIQSVNDEIYCIKGQQITSEIDLVGWPVQKEINPNGKDPKRICEELRAQDSLIVLPHPRRDKWDRIKLLFDLGYITAVEYNCFPVGMEESNRFAKELAYIYKVPLIGGSDARNPSSIMPCTRLKCERKQLKRFRGLSNIDDFIAYVLERMVNGDLTVDERPAPLAASIAGYARYAASALRHNPVGTVKSFVRSHF